MPRAKNITTKTKSVMTLNDDGWALITAEVTTSCGTTYRARLVDPDGVLYICPTNFRKQEKCIKWARRELKLLKSEAEKHRV